MAQDTLKVQQGETVYLDAIFTDRDGTAQDPSAAQKIRVVDPRGTIIVNDAAMTDLTSPSTVAGGWTYAYQVAADAITGKWTAQAIGEDGATPDKSFGKVTFIVEKRLGT